MTKDSSTFFTGDGNAVYKIPSNINIRAKENIRKLTFTEAEAAFNSLDPVKFQYKTGKEENVGFIAEDVPDLVATPNRQGLSPMDIVAVLTKVVQKQQIQIDELVKLLKDKVGW